MTTIISDNEYDSSRTGQTSSPAPDGGYADHQNNGFSQGSGNGNGAGGGKPEDERKLFVGGLTWDTTQEDLREYFSSFGNVADCSIKHDPSTGRSRGFAFLVFETKDIVEKILSQSDHFVKGRKVDPKPAHRRSTAGGNQMNANNNNAASLYGAGPSSASPYAAMGANVNPYSNNRKVFIGGLDPSFPDSQLREYFSKFGKIDEIDLPYDKEKNERRPFCFISFQTEQAAQEVLQLQRHTIGDISVDVKRAKPKTMNNQQQQQLQQHMYDPYGQQAAYGNYGTSVPSYGTSAYPAADPYANWSAYSYNQQANPASYPYGGSGSTGAPSPAASSYSQYPEHHSSSQYPYAQSNAGNDYYSQYGYGGQQPAGVYGDPSGKSYGGGAAGGYEYGSYYAPMGAGGSGSMVDNGSGQQSGNSPGNPADYEHDNHYGKAKTSIVSSPTYHPYSRS